MKEKIDEVIKQYQEGTICVHEMVAQLFDLMDEVDHEDCK